MPQWRRDQSNPYRGRNGQIVFLTIIQIRWLPIRAGHVNSDNIVGSSCDQFLSIWRVGKNGWAGRICRVDQYVLHEIWAVITYAQVSREHVVALQSPC